jgi:hypothetical protein
MEVTKSDKHSSLSQKGFNYERNMLYSTSPRTMQHFTVVIVTVVS